MYFSISSSVCLLSVNIYVVLVFLVYLLPEMMKKIDMHCVTHYSNISFWQSSPQILSNGARVSKFTVCEERIIFLCQRFLTVIQLNQDNQTDRQTDATERMAAFEGDSN